MPKFSRGPRLGSRGLPMRPRMPTTSYDRFKRTVLNPFYPLSQEYKDEQYKRGMIAAAHEEQRRREEERLHANGFYDQSLTCQRCSNTFLFSARDKEFYQSKNFTEPKYCPSCRPLAKAEKEQQRAEREVEKQRRIEAQEQHRAEREQRRLDEEYEMQALGFYDKTVYCQHCYSPFEFSAREQYFYHTKGYTEPKYCPNCRPLMRAQKQAERAEAQQRRADLAALDYDIVCKDCSTLFTFTGQEQERFQERGWTPPVRCPQCREARKRR